MWEKLSYRAKLMILEGETTVMKELLDEDETLVQMLKRGDSKEMCLNYINENW
jgi:hypothetical protein